MDVLKFIGGRRSKCIFLHLKKEKNAFRLHEERNSNVTNDNFGDGETAVLRVYILYVYIANRRMRKPQAPNLPRWKSRNAWRPFFFRPDARMWIVQKPRVGGGASQPDDLMIMIHQLVCIYIYIYIYGWWYTYPSEKYES